MAAEVGQMAPEFKLKSHKMDEISLSAQRGKNVLLLFFPLAFTGVCTTEFGIIKDKIDEIHGANGEVFGISVDSPFSQAKWSEQNGYKNVFLSDMGKDTAKAYGAMYDELVGLKGVAKRAAFLVDKNGKIVKKQVLEDAKQLPDIDGFVAEMKNLR
jgi:peroxiredoxin